MGTSLEQATNAGFVAWGVPFRALQLRDYKMLDVWMQDDFRKQCLATARELKLEGIEREEWFTGMMRASAGLTCNTPEGEARVGSVDGMFKLLELASDGAFDRIEFQKLLAEDEGKVDKQLDDALEDLHTRILALSYVKPEEGAGEDESNPSGGQ